jgi:hypothetical protein
VVAFGNAYYVSGRGLALEGIPYSSRPDSVWILYKYSTSANDQGGIKVDLFNNPTGSSRVFSLSVLYPIAPKSEWTVRGYNLSTKYTNTTTPDSIVCSVMSSPSSQIRTIGSTLQVDGIYFNNPFYTGVNDLENNDFKLSVFPNPSNDFLQIQSEKNLNGYQFELHPINGQEAYRTTLTNDNRIFPTTGLPTGNYLWLLVNEKGDITARGKWVKN